MLRAAGRHTVLIATLSYISEDWKKDRSSTTAHMKHDPLSLLIRWDARQILGLW